jgi:hypothetical protein
MLMEAKISKNMRIVMFLTFFMAFLKPKAPDLWSRAWVEYFFA